jgi:hypothetical protein
MHCKVIIYICSQNMPRLTRHFHNRLVEFLQVQKNCSLFVFGSSLILYKSLLLKRMNLRENLVRRFAGRPCVRLHPARLPLAPRALRDRFCTSDPGLPPSSVGLRIDRTATTSPPLYPQRTVTSPPPPPPVVSGDPPTPSPPSLLPAPRLVSVLSLSRQSSSPPPSSSTSPGPPPPPLPPPSLLISTGAASIHPLLVRDAVAGSVGSTGGGWRGCRPWWIQRSRPVQM